MNQDLNSLQPWFEKVSQMSLANVEAGTGGPFAAIILKNGECIAEGTNQVLAANDPTAHAEVVAIRKACEKLQSFQLDDCILVSSCEPCPMCLGAIYWARPSIVYFCNNRQEAAEIGFDDNLIYTEINLNPSDRKIPFVQVDFLQAKAAFRRWVEKADKTQY